MTARTTLSRRAPRRFWGWGQADATLDTREQATVKAMAEQLDVPYAERPVPQVHEFALPTPRVNPPPALAACFSATPLDRLNHCGGKSYADLARMWLRRNTVGGSRRNIRAHYDLSNEFFGLFLDPSMTYSCAIFENGAETLEAAQVEKIDRACRKLELKPTDHLLEIGTGWGAMSLHAATKYGCRVMTTTISDRQHEMAERRIQEAGLQDRITLLKEDYRNLTGQYDKLVSIEMVEAVGAGNIDGYFKQCAALLKPDGAALVQAIVIRDKFFKSAARSNDFLKEYIFPGSCLLSVQRIVEAVAKKTDLRVWEMRDFGAHYVRTLSIWRERYMSRLDEVRAMGYDERFVRMWEYYLAYCEGAFRARHVGDVQVLLTKPGWRGG